MGPIPSHQCALGARVRCASEHMHSVRPRYLSWRAGADGVVGALTTSNKLLAAPSYAGRRARHASPRTTSVHTVAAGHIRGGHACVYVPRIRRERDPRTGMATTVRTPRNALNLVGTVRNWLPSPHVW